MENINFSGRMSDIEFLQRLYRLEDMESYDGRYQNALQDISQHTVNNNDYEGNWVFQEARFNLLDGSDETFLKFVCEMAHPLVRPDKKEALRIFGIANDWLKSDGWELYPIQEIAGGKILSFRNRSANQKPTESEVAHIWTPNQIRMFISHRDRHKADAKVLGEGLSQFGISSFVAHDSIQAMSTWKHEIMKALQTMDAFLCYITSDFHESEWTNQEIGYALARGVPIYLYSTDRTDPKGFKFDTQAIKSGFPELLNCIKGDFAGNSIFKQSFLQNFISARDGSFEGAKNRFFDLVGLTFNDEEIEQIVEAFFAKAKYSNQLMAVLYDKIKDDHKKHPRLRNYSHYREYLNNEILKSHSSKPFAVLESKDENGFDKITIGIRGAQ